MRTCMPLYNTTVREGGDDARSRAIPRFEVFHHFSTPGRELRTMDFRSDLSKVACPTLVLGGMEDPITPPHLLRELAAAIAPDKVTLRLFERAGHGPFRDDPEPVYDVIRRFIGSVTA